MLLAADGTTFAERKAPSFLEHWLVLSALLATVAFPAFSKYQSADQASPNSPVAQVVWSALYVFAAFRLYAMRRQVRPLLARSFVLCTFVLLMLVSSVWSVEPTTTLYNAIELIGTTMIGFYIVVRFSLREFLEMVALTFAAITVSSVALIFGAPGHARMDWGTGAWSGIYQDKNNLGAGMSLAIISLSALLMRRDARYRLPILALIAASAALLVGSNSATAFTDCVVAVIVSFAALLCRSRRFGVVARVVSGLMVVSVGLAVFVFGLTPDSILSVLGRSATLTGRTDFWPYLQQAIGDRPLLGFGYNAFFRSNVGANYLGDYVVQAGGWTPYHAHNSFLQICLDAGYVGALLLGFVILRGFLRSIKFIAQDPTRFAAWPLAIIVYLVLGSFTETYFGNCNTFEWIFFVAALLYPIRDVALGAAKIPTEGRD
jgi:exopolysaccharide production protein ExoQ